MQTRTSHIDRNAVMAGGLVITLLGLIVLALVLLHDGRAAFFGRDTTGEVVMLERERRADRALVQFRASEGPPIQFRSLSTSSDTYTVGQRVPVRYVNADPSLAYVATSAGLYRNLRNGVIVGVILLAAGFVLVRASLRMPVSATGRPLTAYAGPAILVMAGLIGSVFASRFMPALPGQSEILERQREGAALFAAAGAPPDAHVSAARTEDAYGGGKARVTVTQIFEAPGLFPETAAWYAERLAPMGWRVFDRPGRGTISKEWCKDGWFVNVGQANGETTLASPSHHFTLRVEWRPGRPIADCRSPERP